MSFQAALSGTKTLDRFAISGIIASWWSNNLVDLKTLSTLGYKGLVEAWVASVLDALGDEKSEANPLDHDAAKALVPTYLNQLSALANEVAELDQAIKATNAVDEDGEPIEVVLSPIELKEMKTQLALAKRLLKVERGDFAQKLMSASEVLDLAAARSVVLNIFQSDLLHEANERSARRRRRKLSQCLKRGGTNTRFLSLPLRN
ncbi:hypothetical protein KIV56_00950 [Cryobacterium breve]|uniref:Uncharacterized protein n=1 Tax=Cryobacterium breve TaxID=1259258 RepID=A0ABY7NF61_9MICO|nr:hypothetical protein [Cryobacterium breve]WBM80189.1 hypothetical protein KIV56_00950 [Cryobacterium breve]